MKSADYFQHIDGLRAISIVLVLLFHFQIAEVPGGYVGVDVFFVISGFLIIRVIVQGLEGGTFSLLGFWSRRVRRLMPAIAITLLLCMAAGFLVMAPSDYAALGRNSLLAASSLINFSLIGQTDYFAESVVQNPLVHFWSLAVEEQFYFVFPLLALSLFAVFGKVRGRLVTSVALLALGVAAFVGAELLLRAGQQNAAYYLMPARFGQLAFGGALALFTFARNGNDRLSATPPLVSDLAMLAGLGGVVYCALTYNKATPFPGLAAIPVTLSSLALLAFGGRGHLRGLLCNPVLEYLGKISFVLYLLHWPAYSFYSYYVSRPPTAGETAALVAAVFIATVFVHHLVENPVRFSRLFAGNRMFFFIGPAVASAVAAGALVLTSNGYPTRIPESHRWRLADAQEFQRANFGGAGFQQSTVLTLGVQNATPEFILLGDSKMHQFAYGMNRFLAEHGRAALFYADDGCSFMTSHALLYDGRLDRGCVASGMRALELARSLDIPIIFGRGWQGYIEKLADLNGQPTTVSPTEYAKLNADMLRALADANPRRQRIIVIGNNSGFNSALPVISCLVRPIYLGLPCARQSSFSARDYTPHEIEREMVRLLAHDERFTFLPMYDVFCPSGVCSQISPEGVVLFSDPSHLSKEGSLALVPRLLGLAGLYPECGPACRPLDLARLQDSPQMHVAAITPPPRPPAGNAAATPTNQATGDVEPFLFSARSETALSALTVPPTLQARRSSNAIVLRGHVASASTQFKTGGVSVRVPKPYEDSFAGRTVEVRLRARSPDGADAFAVAYSTNDNGNSGWRILPLSRQFQQVAFAYSVPTMVRGADDFIGIMPPVRGSVEIELIEVVLAR